MDVPGVQPQFVAFARVVIHLLQQVQVLESPAAVTLHGMILSDDVLVVVVDVDFLVVVGVLVVVGRRGVDRTGGDVPMVAAVGQAQELVERLERTYALHVLYVEALAYMGRRGKFDEAADTAARLVHRRGAVKQRRLVDEIGRYGGKVGHAEHGIVDAHAVPCHLRVRGRRAAESDRRERRASVALDEDRRIERQDVRHREGDVLLERDRIELRLLHADVFHRPMTDDRDFGDGQMPGRFLLAFRLLRKECGGETNSQSE